MEDNKVEVQNDNTTDKNNVNTEVVSNVEEDSVVKEEKAINHEKPESYFGYYVFVIINAIVGFFVVFILTRFYIQIDAEKGGTFLISHKNVIPTAVALVAVILFMFLTMAFKKLFKMVLLSEIFLYLYVGTLTTVVNVISFQLIRGVLSSGSVKGDVSWKVAEIFAFIIAVVFAFVADKILVFKSYNLNPVKIFSELGMFFGARLVTEAINFSIMWFMIDKKNFDELLTKIVASIIVIILNYIFSKFIIFKKIKDVKET